jgi:endoribonuclease L-PSP, putative
MSNRSIISTENAPAAIGTYSQAVRVGNTVYLSGQIPLDPATMEMVTDSFEAQAVRVFENLKAVAEAAGGSLGDFAKVTILLSDLEYFAQVNEVWRVTSASPIRPVRPTPSRRFPRMPISKWKRSWC